MFMQNFIKLSAAFHEHELSCRPRKQNLATVLKTILPKYDIRILYSS